MTAAVVLPFHQDDGLTGDDLPLPADLPARTVGPALPDSDRWSRMRVLLEAYADAVAESVRTGRSDGVPAVAVTGDCLATVGTLAGVQRAGVDAAVVWFDAHADLHTRASSTSGYLGGMPLRMIVGGDDEPLVGPLGCRVLSEDRVLLVGARDVDPAEADFLATSAVGRAGVGEVDAAAVPSGPLLVHVDLDVLDRSEIPGLRFPVGAGPALDDLVAALRRIVGTGRVALLEVACPWWPAADAGEQQVRADALARVLETATAP